MPVQQRLPFIDGDDGQWGNILNQFISKEHYDSGSDDPQNGGHQKITVRAGTTAAGTAPIKLTSGPLLSTPETGAIEFLSDSLYFTQTTGTTRTKVATYDDASGASGDTYYKNSSGNFARLPIGTTNQTLSVVAGAPAWQPRTSHTPTAIWGDGIAPSSILAGSTTYVYIPYSGTITDWRLISPSAVSATIDIWKASGGTVPTVADTITASAKPMLSSATTANSTALTGWTTTVSAGDILAFSLDSLTGSTSMISLTITVA